MMAGMSKRTLLAACIVAATVLVAACGSSSGGSSPGSGTTASSNTTSGQPDVIVANTNLGPVLADSSSRTLYLLTADRTSLACTGSCLTVWSPLLVAPGSTPKAEPAISGSLGTVDRDGRKQITISGHPLYTYPGDAGSGQTNGQGIQSFGGVWYAVGTSGAPVTGSAGIGATPSPSNGYTY
jgi:predicted lipoprotein with Yx(FWY)xxD motif